MKTFIEYNIYWFTYFFAKRELKDELVIAKWFSCLCLGVLQNFNLGTLLAIIQLYSGYNISDQFFNLFPRGFPKYSFESYFYSFLMVSPFMVLNYIICRKTSQEDIEVYFAAMSKRKKIINGIFFAAYIILSIIAGVESVSIKNERKKEQQSIYKQR